MMSDTDVAGWSLPDQAEMPRDELLMQMEVYEETILLRGFENDTAWVRTVSADGIASALTQHLGFSSGLLPDDALWWNQGETGQVVGLWRPPQVWSVALQREAFKPPARLRLPMPGLVFVCSPGRAPWVHAATSRPDDPEQQLYRAPGLQRLQRREGLSRKPPVPGGGRADTRVLLPVLLLAHRRFKEPLDEIPRQPASTMGGDRWKG